MNKKEADKLFEKAELFIPIFMRHLYIFFTKDDFQKALEWRGEKPQHLYFGVSYKSILENIETGEINTVFMMGIFIDKDEIIVHEVAHIARLICHDMGHDLIDQHDEIMPHLMQWLFAEVKKKQLKGDK